LKNMGVGNRGAVEGLSKIIALIQAGVLPKSVSYRGPLVFRAITYGRNCGRFQRWMPFSGAHSTTC
jgi:hypothetical protein